MVVYQRPTPGQGQFSALPTTYDAGTQKLRVTTTQMGEFIFGYPDVAQTPYVPAIRTPADQSQVNQAEPITLSWTPQGLVGSFDLQVATNADFANLVLDTNNLGSGSFVLQNPLPNTQYFWRVRAVNEGGTSDWASASFTTVPPVLHLTYPAGGEVWQRFQVVTIRWVGNLAENVALDIYKGGRFQSQLRREHSRQRLLYLDRGAICSLPLGLGLHHEDPQHHQPRCVRFQPALQHDHQSDHREDHQRFGD